MLRLVTAEDSDELLDIYTPYVRDTVITFELETPTPAEYQKRVAAISGFYPYLAHESGGRITGYAYASRYHEREGYRYDASVSVYLRPEFQGRGIGRRLYTALFALLKAQGLRIAYAGITLPNARSERMHAAFGFETVGVYRRSGRKQDRWLDVVWMEKFLNDFPASPKPPVSVHELPAGILEKVLSEKDTPLRPKA